MPDAIVYRLDPNPPDAEIGALWRAAWRAQPRPSFAPVLSRSLVHVCAYAGPRLIGFVNVATDGGVHAFLLDTTVHPDFQRRGIATELVRQATEAARARGGRWLHVDYEPHLENFYRGCGFRPTAAGLIRL
ncbi:MAG TPA: GNAT family N-acetyltransferase [Devosiaceae bacterium]|jgi:ribosomal protein S18 acetylase RimI-like enzyme